MHTIHTKSVFVCLVTSFRFTYRRTTPVECIPCMFTEINVVTSLNTTNIDVGTLQYYIPCMILAT